MKGDVAKRGSVESVAADDSLAHELQIVKMELAATKNELASRNEECTQLQLRSSLLEDETTRLSNLWRIAVSVTM